MGSRSPETAVGIHPSGPRSCGPAPHGRPAEGRKAPVDGPAAAADGPPERRPGDPPARPSAPLRSAPWPRFPGAPSPRRDPLRAGAGDGPPRLTPTGERRARIHGTRRRTATDGDERDRRLPRDGRTRPRAGCRRPDRPVACGGRGAAASVVCGGLGGVRQPRRRARWPRSRAGRPPRCAAPTGGKGPGGVAGRTPYGAAAAGGKGRGPPGVAGGRGADGGFGARLSGPVPPRR